MSNEFAAEPTLYADDLMNEPHDMGATNWKAISQSVLSAIRNNGDNKLIMVPDDSWSGAASWVSVHGRNGWISHPANNSAYEAHFYFDMDGSGTYAQPYDDALWGNTMNAVNSFSDWCSMNVARCYVGEYGVPDDDTRWLALLDAVISQMDAARMDGT